MYGHDGPANLAAALAAHGFEPEVLETFMVFDLPARGTELASDGDMFAFPAWVDGVAAAGARLELPPDRAFASMWGAGTDPDFRGRGYFRPLVAERAALARSRGYAFLTVDAKGTSRPILERLGSLRSRA